MTDLQNTYETGLAAGTALTTANSSSGTPSAGDPFNSVTGGTQQFATGNVLFGTRSVTVAASLTAAAYHAWVSMVGATASFALDIYFYMPSVPVTNDQVLFALYRGASGVSPCLIRTNGSIRMTSDAGGGAAIITSPLTMFTAAGWYRVSCWGTANGASGDLHLRAWSVNQTTKVETELFTQLDSTTANLGTGNVDTVRWGRSVAFGPAYTWTLDTVRFRPGSATAFSSFAGNTVPNADAGADQTAEPWQTVTLDGSASADPDGTIAAYAWTQTAGSPSVTLSGSTTSTATFEAPGTIAGTALTFQLDITDNAGGTATDTTVVTVLPVTERIVVGGVEVPLQLRTAT